MNEKQLKTLLHGVKKGDLSVSQALERLKILPFTDLGCACLDTHRNIRRGYGEVIYCQGKTPQQLIQIITHFKRQHMRFLGTKVPPQLYAALGEVSCDLEYCPEGQTIIYETTQKKRKTGLVYIITAGTSDIPVAREAETTLCFLGSCVKTKYDAGVAGIHRIIDVLEEIRKASVIIVVAGMEGALPSVIAGLVAVPVVAVPTSVGYGAHLHGMVPLFSMLNTCSPGVAVVNIDNGFGAGYLAHMINTKRMKK